MRCPKCGCEFEPQEDKDKSITCRDCVWFEEDGYCGYKDKTTASDSEVCEDFQRDWSEQEEYK